MTWRAIFARPYIKVREKERETAKKAAALKKDDGPPPAGGKAAKKSKPEPEEPETEIVFHVTPERMSVPAKSTAVFTLTGISTSQGDVAGGSLRTSTRPTLNRRLLRLRVLLLLPHTEGKSAPISVECLFSMTLLPIHYNGKSCSDLGRLLVLNDPAS